MEKLTTEELGTLKSVLGQAQVPVAQAQLAVDLHAKLDKMMKESKPAEVKKPIVIEVKK